MTNYVSYLRVSTQRQGQSGLGLEAQRAAVDQFLAAYGGALIAEYVEVESGSGKARPVLVQSTAHVKRTGATLLIAKLDRLARNVAFVSSLMEGGVEFVAADAPYANRLMIHVMAAFAEHERSLISERTKAALAAAKARGVVLGANGAVLASTHKAEAQVFAEGLRAACEVAVEESGWTLASVARHLNRAGLSTRQGSSWSPSTVQRVIGRLAMSGRH